MANKKMFLFVVLFVPLYFFTPFIINLYNPVIIVFSDEKGCAELFWKMCNVHILEEMRNISTTEFRENSTNLLLGVISDNYECAYNRSLNMDSFTKQTLKDRWEEIIRFVRQPHWSNTDGVCMALALHARLYRDKKKGSYLIGNRFVWNNKVVNGGFPLEHQSQLASCHDGSKPCYLYNTTLENFYNRSSLWYPFVDIEGLEDLKIDPIPYTEQRGWMCPPTTLTTMCKIDNSLFFGASVQWSDSRGIFTDVNTKPKNMTGFTRLRIQCSYDAATISVLFTDVRRISRKKKMENFCTPSSSTWGN